MNIIDKEAEGIRSYLICGGYEYPERTISEAKLSEAMKGYKDFKEALYHLESRGFIHRDEHYSISIKIGEYDPRL